MIESLRVLKACRKTAVAARRVALQMIHNTVVCAPDELWSTLRKLTRMELIRTLAAWRWTALTTAMWHLPIGSRSSLSLADISNFTTRSPTSMP